MFHLSTTQISSILTQNKCKLLQNKEAGGFLRAYCMPNTMSDNSLSVASQTILGDPWVGKIP